MTQHVGDTYVYLSGHMKFFRLWFDAGLGFLNDRLLEAGDIIEVIRRDDDEGCTYVVAHISNQVGYIVNVHFDSAYLVKL